VAPAGGRDACQNIDAPVEAYSTVPDFSTAQPSSAHGRGNDSGRTLVRAGGVFGSPRRVPPVMEHDLDKFPSLVAKYRRPPIVR
jgi:hypothetical protein